VKIISPKKQPVINPSVIHQARVTLQQAIAHALNGFFAEQYAHNQSDSGDYVYNSAAIAARAWRELCLHYLLVAVDNQTAQALAAQQYQSAQHMTDRLVALRGLVSSGAEQATACLADFYRRFRQEALVIDSWFAVQATNSKATIDDIRALTQHEAFTLTNPNRLRSVLAQFANANPVQFHGADGSGYRFVAEKIAELDAINPQIASRLLGAFSKWKRLESGRQQQALAALQQLSAQKLSNDTYETLNRLLTS
jgi:aminopeptidase N